MELLPLLPGSSGTIAEPYAERSVQAFPPREAEPLKEHGGVSRNIGFAGGRGFSVRQPATTASCRRRRHGSTTRRSWNEYTESVLTRGPSPFGVLSKQQEVGPRKEGHAMDAEHFPDAIDTGGEPNRARPWP
ncbi:penicillin-binding protein [Anopheles sinensis]|uniref:Penicillin-binding protein n=1 Tax=Anopheles sinensis TaxID=74873 RepID=A0A084VH54_ANOSI|nr:penicillin-binding protein [Anopheles sinensis]